jgi:hypothetical protein
METMMKTTLIAATALMILGAPMAFAATGTPLVPLPTTAKPEVHHHLAAATPSAQCTALEDQFSKAEGAHKTMKTFNDAVKLRDQGKSLCTANKSADGVKKLEQALKMIGVTPSVKS